MMEMLNKPGVQDNFFDLLKSTYIKHSHKMVKNNVFHLTKNKARLSTLATSI